MLLSSGITQAAQVRGPYRHYVLNLLWILTLLFCLLLAAHHLRQLHRQTSTFPTSELILPSLSREYTESRSSALSILSSDALQVSGNTQHPGAFALSPCINMVSVDN